MPLVAAAEEARDSLQMMARGRNNRVAFAPLLQSKEISNKALTTWLISIVGERTADLDMVLLGDRLQLLLSLPVAACYVLYLLSAATETVLLAKLKCQLSQVAALL